MEKITFERLRHTQDWEEAVIVFTEDSFDKEYSLDARSYKVSSDCKYFNPLMIGNSLFGDALDGTDDDVRLEYYMSTRINPWYVDYCYITKFKKNGGE